MEKRVIGNFSTQTNKDFPVDCELFESIQSNTTILAILGNIAGDKAILSGCTPSLGGARCEAGYVFLRTKEYPDGEILYWEGGSVSLGVYVRSEPLAVTAQGYDYTKAYSVRSLAPGLGEESYRWEEFRTIQTSQQLEKSLLEKDEQIAELTPAPLGVVQMWAGAIGKIPPEYRLCDGSSLLVKDFTELYSVLGNTHSVAPEGYFSLPDLRSRFVVGYSSTDADYNAIGKSGGKKQHALTSDEMPSHVHSFKDYYYIEAHPGGIDGMDTLGFKTAGSAKSDSDNNYLYYKIHDTETVGGGAAHENRPPFYTLAYIIRVK